MLILAMLCAAAGYAADASDPANPSLEKSKLTALAAAKFPNLTRAERAMLWFADVDNINRGEFAVAGSSADPKDPSNDPAHADKWDHSREIRALLIRWMCVDPDAVRRVDPQGIKVLGARITGALNLSLIGVPFALNLRNCWAPERISLAATRIPYLALSGSHVGEIYAPGIHIESGLHLDSGFQAAGEVDLISARIGNEFFAVGGKFS
jgi:hypothetical protein